MSNIQRLFVLLRNRASTKPHERLWELILTLIMGTRQMIEELLNFEAEKRTTGNDSRLARIHKNSATTTAASPNRSQSNISNGLMVLASKLDETTKKLETSNETQVKKLEETTNELKKANSLMTQLTERLLTLETRQTAIEN